MPSLRHFRTCCAMRFYSLGPRHFSACSMALVYRYDFISSACCLSAPLIGLFREMISVALPVALAAALPRLCRKALSLCLASFLVPRLLGLLISQWQSSPTSSYACGPLRSSNRVAYMPVPLCAAFQCTQVQQFNCYACLSVTMERILVAAAFLSAMQCWFYNAIIGYALCPLYCHSVLVSQHVVIRCDPISATVQRLFLHELLVA